MQIKKQKDKKQRRDRVGIFMSVLLCFFLFPYLLSNFSDLEKQNLKAEEEPGQIWVLQKKFWGYIRMPLEEYLEGMLAATIPGEYNMETLKAQTIILRTYCIQQMEKKDGNKVVWDDSLKELYFTEKECERLWGKETEEKRKKLKQAVADTKGMVLVKEGKIPQLPFCRMSNGQTRDITEYVVHIENYDYLKTIACPEDAMAENYIQYMEMTVEEFQKKIKDLLEKKEVTLDKIVLCRDSAEYVKEVEIGEYKVDGEKFKNAFHLASSCFYLERVNEKMQIKTKGLGHGFGFSQYSANKMAEGGKKYQELLEYFFQNLSIEKI